MSKRLQGKVAIITGGAGGIGFAVAERFIAEGARVVIADISWQRCQQACDRLGDMTLAQELDVLDLASIDALVKSVVDRAGRIDILINAAGVWGMENTLDVTLAEFDRIIGINLRGLLFTMSAVARQMVADGGGTIVNFASAAARRGAAGSGIYSASKAGVISLTQAAAQELAHSGVRVNAIAPGAVQTSMWDAVKVAYKGSSPDLASVDMEAVQSSATPAGRLATADDCVGTVLFLASDDSKFVIGQTINVDGGLYMN
tara:strand:+ start:7137 stop:7913 length:777 start_codon:yes stop_codon:yes gene_type:complete